jgi:type I restriction enzyme M protein
MKTAAAARKRPAIASSAVQSVDAKQIISNNSKFLDEANQLLHNGGVLFEKRIDIILELIHSKFGGAGVDDRRAGSPSTALRAGDLVADDGLRVALQELIQNTTISKEELFQKVFMFYGSKYLKKEFDQFYTPCTVGEFMCSICPPAGRAIDPASGTGDLLSHYDGAVELWDISPDVIELAKQNYAFQGKDAAAVVRDSIAEWSLGAGEYDCALVNPPFGSKTVVTNPDVLKHYELGRGKKKQELGILFVERSMNLLRDGGVLAIILPNGYFGNTTAAFVELRKYILKWRCLAIIKLPQKTFSRSGTGVSTSILVLSKVPAPAEGYPIFIDEVAEIGYELNKKNTPYKYKKRGDGEYVLDDRGFPVLHNDLWGVRERFAAFMRDGGSAPQAQVLNTRDLDEDCILDISRYLSSYKDVVAGAAGGGAQPIRDFLAEDYSCSFKRDDGAEYTYLDIKEINTPLYNGKKLLGRDLPGRAKYLLRRGDILVSRLKGNIAFTVIVEDKKNLVCTNGVCVLRPKNDAAGLVIFANLFTAEFRVQHQALTTGSIMETLADEDIKNIVISAVVNEEKYRKILDSIKTIQEELGQV